MMCLQGFKAALTVPWRYDINITSETKTVCNNCSAAGSDVSVGMHAFGQDIKSFIEVRFNQMANNSYEKYARYFYDSHFM